MVSPGRHQPGHCKRTPCGTFCGQIDTVKQGKGKKTKEEAKYQCQHNRSIKTRFTSELHTVTVQSDTLAGLNNHGFNALSSKSSLLVKTRIYV